MSSDNKTNGDPPAPANKRARIVSSNVSLAMELPFTLVGAVAVAGVLGYFLDRWLHTRPILMIVFGALGFFAGVREVIRRLPGTDDGAKEN